MALIFLIANRKYYMSPLKKRLSSNTAMIALAIVPIAASATNGYFAHGYGVRSKAMAGTGVAFSQDAVAAAINPAGLAYVGNRLDLELELFSPHREYHVQGGPTPQSMFPLNPGTVESDSVYFVVPTIGWSYQLDEQQSIGVTLYGNGGMNTDYKAFTNPLCPPGSSGTGSYCAGRTGVDLAQAFIVGTYAHSFADGRYALGISPIFAAQTFKARGLGSFGKQPIESSEVLFNILAPGVQEWHITGGFRYAPEYPRRTQFCIYVFPGKDCNRRQPVKPWSIHRTVDDAIFIAVGMVPAFLIQ